MESACRVYRPRDPRKTALWGLLDTLYERVKGSWEERFERSYGFWQGLADGAVARYLDCGVWQSGFARVRCRRCPQELLVAFSCKGHGDVLRALRFLRVRQKQARCVATIDKAEENRLLLCLRRLGDMLHEYTLKHAAGLHNEQFCWLLKEPNYLVAVSSKLLNRDLSATGLPFQRESSLYSAATYNHVSEDIGSLATMVLSNVRIGDDPMNRPLDVLFVNVKEPIVE